MTEPVPLPVNDPLNSNQNRISADPRHSSGEAAWRPKGALSKATTLATSATLSAQQTDQPSPVCAVLADRPVAYYRFNESQGSNDHPGIHQVKITRGCGPSWRHQRPWGTCSRRGRDIAQLDGEKGRIIVQNSDFNPSLTSRRSTGPMAWSSSAPTNDLSAHSGKSSFEGLATIWLWDCT